MLTNWWIESQHPARHPSTTSKYSSTLARLRRASSNNPALQVHLQTRMITASKLARSRPPNAYIQTRSITASKCISKLAQSRPPSVYLNSLNYSLQVCTMMDSKCIYKLARSRSRSASLSALDHGLQVCLAGRSITASECISEFTWSSFSGAPQIALKDRLQPIQVYRV